MFTLHNHYIGTSSFKCSYNHWLYVNTKNMNHIENTNNQANKKPTEPKKNTQEECRTKKNANYFASICRCKLRFRLHFFSIDVIDRIRNSPSAAPQVLCSTTIGCLFLLFLLFCETQTTVLKVPCPSRAIPVRKYFLNYIIYIYYIHTQRHWKSRSW